MPEPLPGLKRISDSLFEDFQIQWILLHIAFRSGAQARTFTKI